MGFDPLDLFRDETEEEWEERKREERRRKRRDEEAMWFAEQYHDTGRLGCWRIGLVLGFGTGALTGYFVALNAAIAAGEPNTLRAVAIVIACGVISAIGGAVFTTLLPHILVIAFSSLAGGWFGLVAAFFYCQYQKSLAEELPQSIPASLLERCTNHEVLKEGALIGAIVVVVAVYLLRILGWARRRLRAGQY